MTTKIFKTLPIILLLLCAETLFSQLLTLRQAQELAKNNFPLSKQYALIEQTRGYTIKNANSAYYPKFSINGQATYQSDVTKLPFSLPGINVDELDKEQYKAFIEMQQPIFDGGIASQQKRLAKAEVEVELQKTEVEINKLNDRVANVFYGAMLLTEQYQQLEYVKKDLNLTLKKINAAIQNGTAFRSNAELIKAEIIKIEQRQIEMDYSKKSYLKVLQILLGVPIDENTKLVRGSEENNTTNVNRPELKMFLAQKTAIDAQSKVIKAINIPKLTLFAQAGGGKPSLNMLSNKFELYAIGGVRLIVPINGFYNQSRDLRLLGVRKNMIDIQQEAFLFNTNIEIEMQNAEIAKYDELLRSDDRLIALRESIKKTAEIQLDNGVISSNDYLKEVDAESQAKQNKIFHELLRLIAIEKKNIVSGN